jgi:methanogenic corrinoid protein MtbC1
MGLAETVQAYNEALNSTDGELAMKVIERAVASGLRPEAVVFDVVLPVMESLMSRDCSEGGTSLAMHFSASQIS